jgi:hypothetical protein
MTIASRSLLLPGALVFALSGCATALHNPLPAGYTGPTAHISDSVQPRSSSVANVYAVVEVDGRGIANTFGASARASQGQGFQLTTLTVDRYIPAAPTKLKLRAHPVTGAPVQTMAMQMAGTYFKVEGEVDFAPRPGARYVVRGELKKEGAAVWIEDLDTGQAVTERFMQRP